MESEENKMERKMEYIGIREKPCDIVTIDQDWFDYRKDEKELPKVVEAGADCVVMGRAVFKNENPKTLSPRCGIVCRNDSR